MIKRYIIGLAIITSFLLPFTSRAYIYSGYRWATNGTTVDSGDLSWPWAWISPLAASMSTWNNAGSAFSFSVGNGHKFTVGTTNPSSVATTFYYVSGSNLVNANTVFNQNFSFSTTGEYNKYDVRSIATHELGHWLQLSDLYGSGDSLKTMYGYVDVGETIKRSLETDDINGIQYIYQ